MLFIKRTSIRNFQNEKSTLILLDKSSGLTVEQQIQTSRYISIIILKKNDQMYYHV